MSTAGVQEKPPTAYDRHVDEPAMVGHFNTPTPKLSELPMPTDSGPQIFQSCQGQDADGENGRLSRRKEPIAEVVCEIEPPPDGGLTAWLQVLMGHLMNFNTWGYINSYGLFAGYYIDDLHLSASAVAWTASIQIFLLCFVGAFSGRALDAGYYRYAMTAGCVLQLLAIFMTSLADRYWQLLLAQGVCQGIGNGLVYTPTVGLVSTYFARRRSIAIGLMLCGSVTGGILFPLMAQRLLPTLGFAWTVRVMGFVVLFNVIVMLALARTRLPPRKSGPLLELAAFTELPYTFFAISTFLCLWPVYLSYDYINVFATSIIHTSTSTSLTILLLFNAAGLPGRIIPALLSDAYFGPVNVLLMLTTLSLLLLYLWITITSLPSLYAFTIFLGFTMGGVQGITLTALSSLTKDLSKMGTRIGMILTVLAFSTLTGAPIGGALIDALHGKFWALQVWGGSSVVVGMGFLIAARTAHTGWVLRKRI